MHYHPKLCEHNKPITIPGNLMTMVNGEWVPVPQWQINVTDNTMSSAIDGGDLNAHSALIWTSSGGNDHYIEDEVCSKCWDYFTEEEWSDRHWPHDSIDCNLDLSDCDCEAEVHSKCCWECNP